MTAEMPLHHTTLPRIQRPRPTEDDLRRKLEVCRDQYRQQLLTNDSKDSIMITLGQIATLQMVLGEHPDPCLPVICLM